ncbi:MAG: Maf family nucleotide pyrophosphatase [Muribaculum sp.]|nr:Maf family nucleotide pyrophosphatase [Muribaculaceae bacterium]MCM1081054.1 Maf family nucleotide pyrophosphatase [Muribaculum sp.]
MEQLIENRFDKTDILLASKSPRRRQLLKMANIPYSLVKIKKVDESYPDSLTPEMVPVFLSQKKSQAYMPELSNNQVLITADTVVILGTSILGKPANEKEAIQMLKSLSGRKHKVVTGVTITSVQKQVSFFVSTDVEFDALTDSEIEYYVTKYEPFDKAGSYGIQEWIGAIGIKGISGSYYNVMGLPIQRLYRELQNFIKA